MRTTIDLPDNLLRQAKSLAALRGLKLRELFIKILEKGLNSESEAIQSIPRPRPVPEPVGPRTGIPIPALTNAQMQDLLDREDRGELTD